VIISNQGRGTGPAKSEVKMNPVVMYVDDQQQNLLIFKELAPPNWTVHLFESPIEALKSIASINPWVLLSDQKMPGMQGYQFLQITRGLCPLAIRMIVTGYTDEELMVSSIRDGHIADFIKKPWDEEDVVKRVQVGIAQYTANREIHAFKMELLEAQKEIKELKLKLNTAERKWEAETNHLSSLRKEFVSWVPPFIVDSIEADLPLDNVRRNIASITFDIKNSARLIGMTYEGVPIRNKIIQLFTEAITRRMGFRESVSGDSSYGHFGLFNDNEAPADNALAAAFDFRMALSNLCNLVQMESDGIQVGIALHFTDELPVHIHSTFYQDRWGETQVQKSFDTSSYSADLLHRIEKITHPVPGSNIIMSGQFCQNLKSVPLNKVSLGSKTFAGHKEAVELFLIPSSGATKEDIEKIRVSTTDSLPVAV
jgi:FixJ family two-component response regulator/class 3 adenylate cyclase